MQFVGMQDEGISRQAMAQGLPVMEALHAREGSSDGIGVVTMRIIAMTAEPGFDSFHSSGLGIAQDPVGRWEWCLSIHGSIRKGVPHVGERQPTAQRYP
jgi:hypothetical protein